MCDYIFINGATVALAYVAILESIVLAVMAVRYWRRATERHARIARNLAKCSGHTTRATFLAQTER